MYKGEPSKGLYFFNLLNQSAEFTSELGKVTLASGRLEVELIFFLKENEISGDYRNATLGKLLRISNENNLFSSNEIIAFEMILKQRNYITHNIYALFANLIDETIMEKENLLDSDVELYIERAWQLTENLNDLANLIKDKKKI